MARTRRILVTGGAGFIGSHLCQWLLRRSQVICLDNFQTASPTNVAHLLGRPGFRLMRHDVTKPIPIRGVDEIYNLACPASPVHYQRQPIRTIRTSLLGAMNVLDLARRTGAKILQASTSEVYGDPLVHPQPESYLGNVNPIGPRACYDESKRCAETLFFEYRRAYGIPMCVVRIFNTYGPRMHPADGRVVSNFIVQSLRGEPITLYGDGRQTRSFCYVQDLIRGLVAAMGSPDSFTGPVNLGNPHEITVLELARRIVRLTGSSSRIVRRGLPVDDPERRCPDIRLARRKLGWRPRVSLEQGLQRTIRYFRSLDLTSEK